VKHKGDAEMGVAFSFALYSLWGAYE
jgi:hypothetical protein